MLRRNSVVLRSVPAWKLPREVSNGSGRCICFRWHHRLGQGRWISRLPWIFAPELNNGGAWYWRSSLPCQQQICGHAVDISIASFDLVRRLVAGSWLCISWTECGQVLRVRRLTMGRERKIIKAPSVDLLWWRFKVVKARARCKLCGSWKGEWGRPRYVQRIFSRLYQLDQLDLLMDLLMDLLDLLLDLLMDRLDLLMDLSNLLQSCWSWLQLPTFPKTSASGSKTLWPWNWRNAATASTAASRADRRRGHRSWRCCNAGGCGPPGLPGRPVGRQPGGVWSWKWRAGTWRYFETYRKGGSALLDETWGCTTKSKSMVQYDTVSCSKVGALRSSCISTKVSYIFGQTNLGAHVKEHPKSDFGWFSKMRIWMPGLWPQVQSKSPHWNAIVYPDYESA